MGRSNSTSKRRIRPVGTTIRPRGLPTDVNRFTRRSSLPVRFGGRFGRCTMAQRLIPGRDQRPHVERRGVRCRFPFPIPPGAPSAPRSCMSRTAGARTAGLRSAPAVGLPTTACRGAARPVATPVSASAWSVTAPSCRIPGGCGGTDALDLSPGHQSWRRAKKTGCASKAKADSANITRESSSAESIAQQVLNWTVPPGKSSFAWN